MVQKVAPGPGAYEPALHGVHAILPVVLLKRPGGQGVATVNAVKLQDVPMGHKEQALEPLEGWYFPSLHGRHAVAFTAPITLLAVPAGQGVRSPPLQKEPLLHNEQNEAPLLLYDPSSHG